jgi:hypothetical protein
VCGPITDRVQTTVDVGLVTKISAWQHVLVTRLPVAVAPDSRAVTSHPRDDHAARTQMLAGLSRVDGGIEKEPPTDVGSTLRRERLRPWTPMIRRG